MAAPASTVEWLGSEAKPPVVKWLSLSAKKPQASRYPMCRRMRRSFRPKPVNTPRRHHPLTSAWMYRVATRLSSGSASFPAPGKPSGRRKTSARPDHHGSRAGLARRLNRATPPHPFPDQRLMSPRREDMAPFVAAQHMRKEQARELLFESRDLAGLRFRLQHIRKDLAGGVDGPRWSVPLVSFTSKVSLRMPPASKLRMWSRPLCRCRR